MVTAPMKWRRWCGPRSELVRATQMAADELRAASGLDVTVEVRVEDRSGLTETKPSLAALTHLHADELRNIASVNVTVKSDREQWWERRRQAREEGRELDPPRDAVSIRDTGHGTTLEVEGDDRTRVEYTALNRRSTRPSR